MKAEPPLNALADKLRYRGIKRRFHIRLGQDVFSVQEKDYYQKQGDWVYNLKIFRINRIVILYWEEYHVSGLLIEQVSFVL